MEDEFWPEVPKIDLAGSVFEVGAGSVLLAGSCDLLQLKAGSGCVP